MALNANLKTTALNAQLKTDKFECWERDFKCLIMALNAKPRKWSGSERQAKNNSSKCQNQEKMVALNIKLWGNDEGKYALVWHVTTTLDLLKWSKIDSMILKIRSID